MVLAGEKLVVAFTGSCVCMVTSRWVTYVACLLERPWTAGHEVCLLVQSDGAGARAEEYPWR